VGTEISDAEKARIRESAGGEGAKEREGREEGCAIIHERTNTRPHAPYPSPPHPPPPHLHVSELKEHVLSRRGIPEPLQPQLV